MAHNSEAEQEPAEAGVRTSPTRIADPAMAFEAKRALVWACVVGMVGLGFLLARPLLVIFAGMVFGAMIDGGARLLGRVLPIGRGWRIGIVIACGIGFMIWVGQFAGSQITREAAELPAIIQAQANRALAWAAENGLAIEAGNVQSVAGQLASGVGTVTKALTGILGGITSMALIGIMGIYFAMEPRLYERGVAWMLPEERRHEFFLVLSRMGRQMRHLLAGRLFGMVVEGVFTWGMLALYDIRMAALLGLITGILAFIPNIGAVISGVLMVLVGFFDGMQTGLYTIFVYFTVQTIDGYVLIPLIAKKTVDLAPALVLAGQLIMGVLFGILGLALADPLIAMIKVALDRRSELNAEADARATIADTT